MILIDDALEKEEMSEAIAILPQHSDASEPLLPIPSGYGTFRPSQKLPSARRNILKAFFVAWAIWIAVLCIIFGFKDFLKDDTKSGVSSVS